MTDPPRPRRGSRRPSGATGAARHATWAPPPARGAASWPSRGSGSSPIWPATACPPAARWSWRASPRCRSAPSAT